MLLPTMRKGIFSYLFLGFLLLAGFGLVLTDWTGSYRSAAGSNDIARIGNQTIGAAQFDREARRILKAQQMDASMAYSVGMIDQILEMKITDILLQKGAFEYGVSVDDKHVAKQVNDLVAPMAAQSGVSKKEVLARLLQSNGMTEADLVANLRQDLGQRVLRESITKNYYVPAAVAQDMHVYNSEERTIEVVSLLESGAKDVKEPDDKTLAAYFDGIKEQYNEAESRNFTLAVIDPEKLGAKVDVTDAEVKQFYEENKSSYETGERRVVEQAVVDTPEKAARIAALVKDKKQKLQDAVKSVTGNTKGYTAETGFEKEGLLKDLAEPLFAAREGDVIGPVKSPLGQHIMIFKKTEAAGVVPLEKVSANIRTELLQNKKGEEIYAIVSDIEDRITNGGTPLEEVAKEVGMTLVPVKDARVSSQNLSSLKDYEADEARILQAVFNAQEGETSSLSDLSSGKMFAVRLDSVTPRRQKELKEVRNEVKTRWLTEQRQKANAQYAAEALKKLDKKETTLADIAKARATKVQTFTGLSRTAKPPAGVSPSNLQQIMAAPKGEFIVMPADKGILIGQVTSIKSATKAAEPKDIDETRKKLGADASQENLLMFVDSLQNQHKTTVNERLLKQMYGGDPAEGQ